MKFSLLGFKVEISKVSQLPDAKHQYQTKPECKKFEPVINKPVREFVDTFLARPKTFSLEVISAKYPSREMKLTDKMAGIEFSVVQYVRSGLSIRFDGLSVDVAGKSVFLTPDEEVFLLKSIEGYYSERKRRLDDIRQSRIRRDLSRIYA